MHQQSRRLAPGVGLPLLLAGAVAAVVSCGDEEMPIAPVPADPGFVTVTVSTLGLMPDPDGVTIVIDGRNMGRVAPNSSTDFELAAGQHTIGIGDVAPHCQGGETSLTRFVASGVRTAVPFLLYCPAPGALTIKVRTSGTDLDKNGYLLVVDRAVRDSLAIQSSANFDPFPPGTHEVQLRDVAANCAVTGGRTRSVVVPEQAAGEVTFELTCGSPALHPPGEYLVVSARDRQFHDLDLYLLTSNGVLVERLTDHPGDEYAPTFSPDGERIAFLHSPLPGAYPTLTLYHLSSRTSSVLGQPTTNQANWSPDGARLVYGRGDRLWVLGVASKQETLLLKTSSPTGYWSPDGSRIAFTSEGDVWSVAPNGTDAQRVTSAGSRLAGPWSPSANEMVILVFGEVACVAAFGWMSPFCSQPQDLAVLRTEDAGEHLVNTIFDELNPIWSLDGRALLFVAWDGGNADVYRIPAEGGDAINLTRSPLLEEWVTTGRIKP